MRQGLLRSSRYSPGNMDRESLEALFVGRSDVMEGVLSRVVTSISSAGKHYILIVGPRGSGKTHFLAHAYHRLMDRLDAAGTRASVAVARLNEEEWGVASYLDLVVRILRSLASQAPEINAEIDSIYDRFSKYPADAEALAVDLLRRHTRGKTLLLLCENLVDLFHGLDDEGQKRWRSTIQEDGNWTIVATTPALFSALTLQDNPFYGFFTIRKLEDVDLETGIELLAKKAIHEGRTELARMLRTPIGRARARAIHHLAAGNHRVYVVLFDFLDKESLDDLVGPFMRMVDDLTPYYQDRMRTLPPTQRKIVEFLCLAGKPLTIKDISTPCLMSHQTAAKQISQLETAGFVRKTSVGRRTYCELAEPLMRICIEVKDNKTQHFRLFVEFLRRWFTPRELKRKHAAFQREDHVAELDQVHVEEAVRRSLVDGSGPLLDALHDEAKQCLDTGDYVGLAAIQEVLVQDTGSADDYCKWIYALTMAGDGESATAAGQQAIEMHPDSAEIRFVVAGAYNSEDRLVDACSATDQAIALGLEDPGVRRFRATILMRLDRFEEALRDAEAVLDADPDDWFVLMLVIDALMHLGRLQDAEPLVSDLIRLAPTEPDALLTASRLHQSQGRLDQAFELVDKALDIDADHPRAHLWHGFVLFEMGDYRRASDGLRHFASQNPHSVPAHLMLADSLLESGRFEEAIQVAEHLLEIDQDRILVHRVRGLALIELGRSTDAITAFDELLPTDNCDALLDAASEVRAFGHHAAARRYLDRVAELQPENRELWIERTHLHIDEGAFNAAVQSAAKLAALPEGSLIGRLLAAQATAATQPLHTALDTLGTTIERADFQKDDDRHLLATADILTISVREFGPRYLAQGLAKLRELLKDLHDEGIVGGILINFLSHSVGYGFPGSSADWEAALENLAALLADLPDCRIPVGMLQAAVRYTKTGDQRHLLSLPLEQRRLLDDVLPPAADERRQRDGTTA